MTMTSESWWHLHAGTCDHGIYVSTLAGESLVHPEMMPGKGRSTFRVPAIGCEPECTVELVYVRSWNHEPSEAEIESITPWEHRS